MNNQLLLLGLLTVLLLVNIILSSVTLSKLNKKDGYAYVPGPKFNQFEIPTKRESGSLMGQ